MISVINESDFNINHGLYAVKFWAPWCGPCRLMDPMIKKLEDEFKDVKFLSIDIDQPELSRLAKKFEIRSIPTLLLIKNGEIFNKIIGAHQLKSLRLSFNDLVDCDCTRCSICCKLKEKDNLDVAL